MIDHKNDFGAGGELDVKIQGTKITIKEKKAPSRDGHHAYLCIDKPGNYDFDIQTDCDITFRIAKCPNLESTILDKILSTPVMTTGRLYILNCKSLVSIVPPQAVGMPIHLEKLPTLNAASVQACEDVCKKSNQDFFDLDKR